MKPQHHKLSARDKKKHFPELSGGKGDCPRRYSRAGEKAYRSNKFWTKAK